MARGQEKSVNIIIDAYVVAGRGRASIIRAADVKSISEKHNISLINGSLNLISKTPTWLNSKKSFYNNELSYYWHADLNGMPVVINKWYGCPAHIFEIFATKHLRTELDLVDNEKVILTIPREFLDIDTHAMWKERLKWKLAWSKREEHYYKDGVYQLIPRCLEKLWAFLNILKLRKT